MEEKDLMQFEVKEGFEFAGKEWRVGEILNVSRSEGKVEVTTMDGKSVAGSETAFQSLRNNLKNITPQRD